MGLFGGSVNDQMLQQRVARLEEQVAALQERINQLSRTQTTSSYGTPPQAAPQQAPVVDAGFNYPVSAVRDAYVPTPRVADLLRSGRKIEAIKAIREETSLGLKEAKDLAERIEASGRY